MIIISARKLAVFMVFVLLAGIIALTHNKGTEVFSSEMTKRIIIDAGHGFPDGGAIGINGSIESTLNLKIALSLKDVLSKKGYTVIMTRTDENALSDKGKTLSEKKRNDMEKRLEIMNTSDADMFVSIHINKFTDSRYNGAQVIYSDNFMQSQSLASFIQKELCSLPDNKSKRKESKAQKNLFLLRRAEIPAIIVECGFSSNFAEEQLLLTKEYQKELAKAIAAGIENYYISEKEDFNENICNR